ncbi:MAG: ROK family protein [Clostridia bacterium]|nr:ROK family protein [Clostridia bacterium]
MAWGENIDLRINAKKNLVLNIIRENPGISRASVKTQSGLSMESILSYIDDLLKDNLIQIAGFRGQGVGRKAVCLKINPDGCYFLGIKFNSEMLVGTVIDFGLSMINKKQVVFKNQPNADEVLQEIYRCIAELLNEMGEKKHLVVGIGIGIPGYVDVENGISIRYYHIKDWNNIPVKMLVEKKFGIPVFIEKSVKLTGLAVKLKKESIKVNDLLFIVIGKGVGMVSITGNETYVGNNNAAEIGHIFVEDNGIVCSCGKTGCLETIASRRAILRELKSRMDQGGFAILRRIAGENPDIADIVQAAEEGDKDAERLIEYISLYVAKAVSMAIAFFGPKKIILSGDITVSTKFQEVIARVIQNRCHKELVEDLQICYENCDALFDARGAALLVYYNEFKAVSAIV